MVLTDRQISQSEKCDFMSSGAALVLSSDIPAGELLATMDPYIQARIASKEERIIETAE
jgi:hypothetical protein